VSIADQVRADAAEALKGGDRTRAQALRLISSELQRAHKEGGDVDEIAVLQRERKRRLEAAQAYRDAERQDLAESEEAEAAIVEQYLPDQLSDAELDAIVLDALAQSGAAGPQELGKVMAIAMPRVRGRADGKRVSALVQEKLG
jgi:uncharacterized protein YqeY